MTKTKAAPSPFPAVPKAPQKPRQEIDPDLLVVEHNQPVPQFRTRFSNKYGPVFAKLKPGSSIRCEPSETSRLAQALRKELERGRVTHLKGCTVVSRERCPDGHGRVWAMKGGK